MYKGSTTIRLQSFNLKTLEVYGKFLRRYKFKSELPGTIDAPKFVEQVMPLKERTFTVLKSPHVHKKTKVQYTSVLHFKRFTIENVNASAMVFLMRTLPKGVHLRFFLELGDRR